MLRCGVVKYRAMSVTCSLSLQHMSLSRTIASFPFSVQRWFIFTNTQCTVSWDFPKRFHIVNTRMETALRDFLIGFVTCRSGLSRKEGKGEAETVSERTCSKAVELLRCCSCTNVQDVPKHAVPPECSQNMISFRWPENLLLSRFNQLSLKLCLACYLYPSDRFPSKKGIVLKYAF